MIRAWSVPTIDISPYARSGSHGSPRARARVAAEIDSAASEVGFMQIVGHDIPAETIADLGDAMDGLFAQPLEAKKRYRGPAKVNRGYSPPRSESLSLSLGVQSAAGINEFFEAFNIGTPASSFPDLGLPEAHYPENLWPDLPAGFEAALSAYFAEAGRVARTLTGIFADALGLPDGYFNSYTDHSIDVLRTNNYALPDGTVELDGNLTGMGEHTDYGIVTVLWAEQTPGLQVLGSDHVWHDVSPSDGALLVNLGDLTARWTNERWMSTLHRVKPPIVDGAIQRRRSAAYFHDGNADAVISTIPSCLDGDGRSKYPPVQVSAHLEAKLAGSRAGAANTAATREAERIRAGSTADPIAKDLAADRPLYGAPEAPSARGTAK